MNERIFEFAKQADLIQWDTLPSGARTPDHESVFRAKKFALLIVLEMCNVLDRAQWDKGEDWLCADGTRIIEQIREHFGVEE